MIYFKFLNFFKHNFHRASWRYGFDIYIMPIFVNLQALFKEETLEYKSSY